AGAIEAEQFAGGVAGFEDAIGEECEGVFRVELEGGVRIFSGADDAERQPGFEGNFDAVAIGRKMTGVGEGDFSISRDARAKAGDEAALLRVDELLIEPGEEGGGG